MKHRRVGVFQHALRPFALLAVGVIGCSQLVDLDYGFAPGDCATGSTAGGTEKQRICSLVPCTNGQTRCEGLSVQLCAAGDWLTQQSCSLACSGGRCSECSAGTRCKDGAVEDCTEGAWQFARQCDANCEAGQCVDVCTEGRSQCNGDSLQRCSEGQYVDEQTCPVTCLSTASGDVCGGECLQNSARCAPNAEGIPGNETESCGPDSMWSGVSVSCGEAFCVAGACQPCAPESRRCGDLGPEQCTSGGQWARGDVCGSDRPECFDGRCVTCAPGSLRCSRASLETCTSDGSGWELTKTCAGDTPTCLDSLKDCGRCRPGEHRCQDDTQQVCGEDGQYEDERLCGADAPHCVLGACAVCKPDARDCVGSTPRICSLQGEWVNQAPCSGELPVCVPATASCACQQNAQCVDAATERRCVDGSIVQSACASDSDCQLDRCRVFEWTQQFGTVGGDRVTELEVDGGNNVIVAGITDGPLPEQTKVGLSDAFVRKYSPRGAALWTDEFGANLVSIDGMALDAIGNVFVAGSVDSGALPDQLPNGGADAFVRSYDPDGRVLWTQQFGTNGGDAAAAASVAGGFFAVAGGTNGVFPGQPGTGASTDVFVRLYGTDLAEHWTRQFGTGVALQGSLATAVVVDAAGNVVVAGTTNGTLPGQTSVGLSDIFLRKYDLSGSEVWTRQLGTTAFDNLNEVAFDAEGNILVLGLLYPSVMPDGGGPFVAKLGPDGSELWTRRLVVEGASVIQYSLSVDAAGDVYIGGVASDVLPPVPSDAPLVFSAQDPFVRKYDKNGNELFTRRFSIVNDQAIGFTASAPGVGSDANGNIFLAGGLDSFFLGYPEQTQIGGTDAFVLKIAP